MEKIIYPDLNIIVLLTVCFLGSLGLNIENQVFLFL